MTKSLSAKQLKAIAMLAEGQSSIDVAYQLGVTRRTVERWLDRPDFRSMLEQTKAKAIDALADEIFQKCKTALTKGLPKSVKRILDALDHSDARIQIRAAEAIAKWSGFYQPTSAQTKSEQQQPAEESLKTYLEYLASKNGNSNGTSSSNR